ncbi:MAG: hypothetical protein HZB14_04710 [Actinobacteria bacterium]|nr:hypothetical protein [Actinomycetota bacterium]
MADRGNEIEKLKRQAGDLIAELHARNLAIPAGLLVVLILAAVFVLPKSPTPPAPVSATPISTNDDAPKLAQVASLTLVSATPLSKSPQSYGSYDPFDVGTEVECVTIKTSKPRQFACKIGDVVMAYECTAGSTVKVCVEDAAATGSSSSTGGSSTETTGGSTPDSGGGDTGSGDKKTTSTYYTIDVTYDGKSYKDLEAGDQLPGSGTAIVFYAGPNSSAKKAGFVLGDNVSVQGATSDPDLGTFEISTGDEVVLTEADGQTHSLTLKKIEKVTK